MLYNAKKYKIKSKTEKTALALIIGGGIGNLIDRFCRPAGVIDFINVKVYGFLGYDYWPTFNIADSCVVTGVLLIIVYSIVSFIKEKRNNANNIRR